MKIRLHEQLEAVDMSQDGVEQQTMGILIEHVMNALGQHRLMAAKAGVAVNMDSTIISALVVCAGIIHGELVETGQVHDNIDPDALNIMLQDNWLAGIEAAKAKVADFRAKRGCGDPLCTVCDGVAGSDTSRQ